MDFLAEKLDKKLREWKPEVAEQVRQHLRELIDLGDQECLDIMLSRKVEQETLDILDEPLPR